MEKDTKYKTEVTVKQNTKCCKHSSKPKPPVMFSQGHYRTPEQSWAAFEDAASVMGVPPSWRSHRFFHLCSSAVVKHCVFLQACVSVGWVLLIAWCPVAPFPHEVSTYSFSPQREVGFYHWWFLNHSSRSSWHWPTGGCTFTWCRLFLFPACNDA